MHKNFQVTYHLDYANSLGPSLVRIIECSDNE